MSHNDRFYTYRIGVGECPDKRWFDGLEICQTDTGKTVIIGEFDQSALHGVLNRIRDLNLELIFVQRDPTEKDGMGSGDGL